MLVKLTGTSISNVEESFGFAIMLSKLYVISSALNWPQSEQNFKIATSHSRQWVRKGVKCEKLFCLVMKACTVTLLMAYIAMSLYLLTCSSYNNNQQQACIIIIVHMHMFVQDGSDSKALSILTYIGCAISIICLSMAVIAFIGLRYTHALHNRL